MTKVRSWEWVLGGWEAIKQGCWILGSRCWELGHLDARKPGCFFRRSESDVGAVGWPPEIEEASRRSLTRYWVLGAGKPGCWEKWKEKIVEAYDLVIMGFLFST